MVWNSERKHHFWFHLGAGLVLTFGAAFAAGATEDIELGSLNGRNGFVITGYSSTQLIGQSAGGAGDLNGDGTLDIIIGYGGTTVADAPSIGVGFVIFGNPSGFPRTLPIASLDGGDGFGFVGGFNEATAYAASAAGDVNGDGIGDVIFGAHGAGPAGASYVVFGVNAQRFVEFLHPTDLDGLNGFVIEGGQLSPRSGCDVSSAGDLNGDSIDDLLVGSCWSFSILCYVVFGDDQRTAASLDLSSLDGSDGFVIVGSENGDLLRPAVTSVGDMNGDGLDDIALGAPGAGPGGMHLGAVFVVFGNQDGFNSTLDLGNLDGSNGFVINGRRPNGGFGSAVSSAGDVNADGFGDLVAGAPHNTQGGEEPGEAYVVFGRDHGFDASLELADLNGRNGFVIAGHAPYGRAGSAVGLAGDLNGDRIDDLIVAAPETDLGDDFGTSYIVFGRTRSFEPVLNVSALDGKNGFAIVGSEPGQFPYSVGGVGDVNGDKLDDVIIGAPIAGAGETVGEAYVVFGDDTFFLSGFDE